jgi:hypothetical protein
MEVQISRAELILKGFSIMTLFDATIENAVSSSKQSAARKKCCPAGRNRKHFQVDL